MRIGSTLVTAVGALGIAALTGCGSSPAGHPALPVSAASTSWGAKAGEPHVVRRIPTGSRPCAVLGAAGSVWVADINDNKVSRLDPATGKTLATIATDAGPCGPAGRPALRPAIPLLDWTNGHYRSSLAPQLAALSRARLLGDGVASLAMFSSSARYNSVLNYFLASFNGDLGQLTPAMKRMKTPVPGVASKPGIQQLDSIALAIAGSGFPIRILVLDRATAARLRALLASHRLRATMVLVPAS